MRFAELSGSEHTIEDLCGELDNNGLNALHILVQGGHLDGAVLLLEAGADPNVQTYTTNEYLSGEWGQTKADGAMERLRPRGDRTALHVALCVDDPSREMVQLLLKNDADVNVRDLDNRTALHLALDFQENVNGVDLEIAELLLGHGADPSLGSNEIGMANGCIHAAVDSGDVAALSLLLRHDVSHSTAGRGGWTPLALATRTGNIKAIQALLAAGADPDLKAPMGKSARQIAQCNKRPKVLEIFASRSPSL